MTSVAYRGCAVERIVEQPPQHLRLGVSGLG
jgi:hypothetical protein